jgi:hypothetical protein
MVKEKRKKRGLRATSEMWCISRFGLGTNCVFHCNTDIVELPIKKIEEKAQGNF